MAQQTKIHHCTTYPVQPSKSLLQGKQHSWTDRLSASRWRPTLLMMWNNEFPMPIMNDRGSFHHQDAGNHSKPPCKSQCRNKIEGCYHLRDPIGRSSRKKTESKRSRKDGYGESKKPTSQHDRQAQRSRTTAPRRSKKPTTQRDRQA